MKRFIGLFLLVTLFFSLLACKPTTTTDAELNLMLSGFQQPAEKSFFRTFVMLFEAENNIKVNVTYLQSGDLETTIQNEQQSGIVTCDVIMVDTAHMSNYVNNEWMADLFWLMEGYSDRTFTSIFDPWIKNEEVWCFAPVSFDVYLSIFNKKALPYLPDTVETLKNEQNEITAIRSITWPEYEAWAIAIREGTGSPKTGFPMATTSSQLLYPMGGMALAYGADGFPIINDPKALSAWNSIARMAASDAIVPENILSSTNQPSALLNTETLWLSFGHMGPIGSSYDLNPSWYVLGPAPVDETTGTAGSTAGAWCFGIVKDALHPTSATKWMEFITRPEINYLYCTNMGGVISPIEEVVEHLGDSNTDRIMKIGIESFKNGINVVVVNTSVYTVWADVKTIYTALYRRLLTGVALSQEEADGFQEQLDNLKIIQ